MAQTVLHAPPMNLTSIYSTIPFWFMTLATICGLGCATATSPRPGEDGIEGDDNVVVTCGSGVTLCGSECVNPSSDRLHCGGCSIQCGSGSVCADGLCIIPGMSVSSSSSGTGGTGGMVGAGGMGGSGGNGGSGGIGGSGGNGGSGGSGGNGGSGEGGGPLQIIDYPVIDAEYDKALDKVIIVSTSPSALHIHDPFSHVDQVVPLPVVPTSVSVSPDGKHAAVGHDAWVTYVDLAMAKVVKTWPVTTNALDIVLAGNGYAYVFPKQDQWESIRSINLATGAQTYSGGASIYAGTVAKLHPGGKAMYGADNGLSPSDIEKYSITGGTAQYSYDSPYHGDFSMCGNLWISEDGERIFTRCGNVFKSSEVQGQDMTYAGKLANTSNIRHLSHSSAAQKVMAIPGSSMQDTAVHVYEQQFLQFEQSLPLPTFDVGGTAYATHGRFVFVSSSGQTVIVVLQLDPAAGALDDFGIVAL